MQPLAHRLARGHRGTETPRHELVDRLQPGDAALTQFCNAGGDQVRVGTTGPEAELAGRQPALDLGRQAGQFVQKGLVAVMVRLAAGDAVGQAGQGTLDGQDARRLAARDRQGEQRHHAVGLDLEQALQHAAGLVGGEAAVQQQHARKAVLAGAEIRAGDARAVGHFGARDGVAVEPCREVGRGRTRRRLHALHAGMQGRHRGARDARQPARRELGCRGGGEGLGLSPAGVDAVARELAMALPLQAQARSQRDAELGGARRGRLQAVLLAQAAQVLQFALALRAVDQHGHMRGPRRGLDGHRRPRMHLVGQREPVRVVGRQPDHDARAPTVAAQSPAPAAAGTAGLTGEASGAPCPCA